MSLSAEHRDATAVEAAAARLLATREHSRFELEQKLRRRGHDCDRLASTLDDLQRRGLLSDERFVAEYVRQRVRKGYGPLRLRAELSERGVTGAVIEQGFEAAAIDWRALMIHAAERKFGGDDLPDSNALMRRGRYLERRGFPISLIRRYLNGLHSAG